MKLELVDGIRVLSFDLISTTALALILLFIGGIIRKKVKFFRDYCIPEAVIGGFGFALIAFLLRQSSAFEFKLNTTLSDVFMYAFFVTIGLGTGLDLLKKGGKSLLRYLIVCWGLALVQNGLGAGLASLLGIDPLLGIAAGAVALEGGHGMAAAMTPAIEAAGGVGAMTVGMAAATYGLVSGSLIGGPLGNYLIKKHNVKIETDQNGWDKLEESLEGNKNTLITGSSLIQAMTIIFVVLLVGINVAKWITNATGFTVPGHVFSLFIGLLFRALNDKMKLVDINFNSVDAVSDVSLVMFLTMAMMNLKIWELSGLALPLIIMLVIQTIVIIFIAIFIMFRVMGSNYDAALLSAGFIGHGLGATANGLAVMGSVTQKYGVFSKKAFLIVPVAGSMLIDIVGVPVITIFTNLFAH